MNKDDKETAIASDISSDSNEEDDEYEDIDEFDIDDEEIPKHYTLIYEARR